MGNNDYNYYKNEYSKYKNNYYSPSQKNANRKKVMRKRFFRAFLVFFIIFAIIAALVFGGIKLYSYFKEKDRNEEPTTVVTTVEQLTNKPTTTVPEETTTEETTTAAEETTTAEPITESTTKIDSQNIVSVGSHKTNTAYYLDTDSGACVNLRVDPTSECAVLRLLPENTKVIFSRFSNDKKWGYTSNLSQNGWVALEYARYTSANANTNVITTKNNNVTYYYSTTSLKYYSNTYAQNTPSFNSALAIFGADTSHNLYLNCKVSTSTKIIGRNLPSDTAKQITTFNNGTSLKIYSVRYGYGRTRVNGKDVWLPTSCLQFVSWGHYHS